MRHTQRAAIMITAAAGLLAAVTTTASASPPAATASDAAITVTATIPAAAAVRSRPAAIAAALAAAAGPVLAAGSAAPVRAPQGGSSFGQLDSISCPSAGNCAAVGSTFPQDLFVVSEKHGTWGTAEAVPGMAALLGSKPFEAAFSQVSCSSAGNCGAGGYYYPGPRAERAFVVSEKNGTWGTAKRIPGPTPAYKPDSEIDLVSCPSAGNCSASGSASGPSLSTQIFLVSQKNGVWGKAEKVPGAARLGTGTQITGINQIACTSAGNCLGAGIYYSPKGPRQFLITEKHGRWGSARAFPRFITVACTSAGNCTGVGTTDQHVVFAIRQKNGIWGPITPIPGINALLPGGSIDAGLGSLSCLSPGNCTAGGDFAPGGVCGCANLSQPFVVTEKNGTWGNAHVLPGVAALSANSMYASLEFGAVICRSAGNCSVAGTYNTTPLFYSEVFVSTEKNGVWGNATELPGIGALNAGLAGLSCGAPGNCSLGGYYKATQHAYVATQKNGTWGNAENVNGIAP